MYYNMLSNWIENLSGFVPGPRADPKGFSPWSLDPGFTLRSIRGGNNGINYSFGYPGGSRPRMHSCKYNPIEPLSFGPKGAAK